MTGDSQRGPAPPPSAALPGPRTGGFADGLTDDATAPGAGSVGASAGPGRSGEDGPRVETTADTVTGAGQPLLGRLPRHWTWAATAAVLGGLLCSGGLTAWHRTHSAQPPDLHGYLIYGSPCARGALNALGTLPGTVGPPQYVDPAVFFHGSALDSADCAAASAPIHVPNGPTYSYSVTVSVELHKKTDPRAEFDDRHTLGYHSLTPADEVTPVPHLGDEAYLLLFRPSELQLKVRHGGAVVALVLSMSTYAPASFPEPTLYSRPLIDTARTVLTNLAAG